MNYIHYHFHNNHYHLVKYLLYNLYHPKSDLDNIHIYLVQYLRNHHYILNSYNHSLDLCNYY